MTEYLPNRFECCDTRLALAFTFCPYCGAKIPRRVDTPADEAARKRLIRQKMIAGQATSNEEHARELERRIAEGLVAPAHEAEVRQNIAWHRKSAETLRERAGKVAP
jgi:hypothetical protein